MTHRIVLLLATTLGLTAAGELSAQLEIEGRPALTQADGPCFDNSKRFVDCGNGTVTDTVTGLIWLQRADCNELQYVALDGSASWPEALLAAWRLNDGRCGLSDGSEEGDWRLPTPAEWREVLDRAKALGCDAGSDPAWLNDAGTGCLFAPGTTTSFLGVLAEQYWSGSVDANNTAKAWAAQLSSATVGSVFMNFLVDVTLQVWPVRDGR